MHAGVVRGGARSGTSRPHGRLVLWSGNSSAFAAALIHQVPLVLRGFRVFNVDCALRFNVFLLADEAARRGVAPEEVLQRVQVQRAFTPYQILDVLRAIQKAPGNNVYFLLAPCKQFFDGDVGHDEAIFLLGKMLDVLRELQAQTVPILIVERTDYRHPAFAQVNRRLTAMADGVGVGAAFTHTQRRQRAPDPAEIAIHGSLRRGRALRGALSGER